MVPSSRKIKHSDKVPHKIYQVLFKPGGLEDTLIPMYLEGRKLQFFWKVQEAIGVLCDNALSSENILKELKGFNLIIHDSTALCGALIGELLDIPRVEILPLPPNAHFGITHMIPMPVSYVPQQLLGFSDEMTFMERVMNLGGYLGLQLGTYLVRERILNALKVKYNIKPERSIRETVGDAEMLIITADFAVEYPQPLLPGMKKKSLPAGESFVLSEYCQS